MTVLQHELQDLCLPENFDYMSRDAQVQIVIANTWLFARIVHFLFPDFQQMSLDKTAWILHGNSPEDPVPEGYIEQNAFRPVSLKQNLSLEADVCVELYPFMFVSVTSNNERIYDKAGLDNYTRMFLDMTRIEFNRIYLQFYYPASVKNVPVNPEEILKDNPKDAPKYSTGALLICLDFDQKLHDIVYHKNLDFKTVYGRVPDNPKNNPASESCTIIELNWNHYKSLKNLNANNVDEDFLYDENFHQCLLLLSLVFNTRMNPDKKVRRLQKRFGIEDSSTLRKELDIVSRWGRYLEKCS